MADQDSFSRLLNDTAGVLTFHQTLGIDHYPASEGLRKFLAKPKGPARQPIARGAKPNPGPTAKPKTKGAPASAPLPAAGTLSEIRTDLGDCQRCSLHETRTTLLFGSGGAGAELMIIGEWPGREDDLSGDIFSSTAGEMLDKMLANVLKLGRDQVYLTSLVKCAPPTVKPPGREQITACLPFLHNQISAVAPKIICTMGPLAAQTLLKDSSPLTRLRGRFHDFHGIPLLATFHPSFLLKNPEMKKATLVDLQMIAKKLLE